MEELGVTQKKSYLVGHAKPFSAQGFALFLSILRAAYQPLQVMRISVSPFGAVSVLHDSLKAPGPFTDVLDSLKILRKWE